MKSNMMARWFFLCVLLLGFSAFAITEEEIQKIQNAIPDELLVQPEKERTILVFSLSKGFEHSCIPYWIKALDLMSEKTGAFKVVHSTDMGVFTQESLNQFDAICFNNTTKLTPDASQQKAIIDFITAGKGIVGIHAATDNFDDWPEGMEMMGGVFTGHPWTANGTWAVKNDDPSHPLTNMFKGKGFKIKDEIYRTDPPLFSRKKQRVLLSLDMSDPTTKKTAQKPEDQDTGITWIKPVGKGRLFYCSLGHNHHLTWNKPVLEHFLAGIQYTLGDLEVDDSVPKNAESPLPTDTLNALFGDLKKYDWAKSQACLIELEALIKQYYLSPENLRKIELMLVETLNSDISLAAKDFVCRQLALIGSDASVETLLNMLDSPKTADLSRYALENISSPRVDHGLLRKLDKVSEVETQIGIITTLSVRKCDVAVDKLAKTARSDNFALAAASVRALGSIGSLKALEQLQRLDDSKIVQDSLLCCAESLLKNGQHCKAKEIYSELYLSGNSSTVRAAAIAGLVKAGDNQSLLTAIEGDDPAVQKVAIMQVGHLQDIALLKLLASKIKSFPDAVKVQMLAALAANENAVGRAEIQSILVRTDSREVRLASYRALSILGDASTVELLAGYATQASDRDERKQAQEALCCLSGEGVDLKIVEIIKNSNSDEAVVVELIKAVAQRPIPLAYPVLLKTVRSSNREISSESIRALQSLATEDQVVDLVDLLIDKPGTATENLVIVTAEKIQNRNSCAEAVLGKYTSITSEQSKASMLRVMGKLGDENSVALIKKEYASKNATLHEAAFRAMSDWPGSDFMAEMKELAQSGNDAKTKILAFRAYLKAIQSSADEMKIEQKVDALIEAFSIAQRPDEKKMVIGALADYRSIKALYFVKGCQDNDTLRAEAEIGVLQICQKLFKEYPKTVKPILIELKDSTNNESIVSKINEMFG